MALEEEEKKHGERGPVVNQWSDSASKQGPRTKDQGQRTKDQGPRRKAHRRFKIRHRTTREAAVDRRSQIA